MLGFRTKEVAVDARSVVLVVTAILVVPTSSSAKGVIRCPPGFTKGEFA